MDIATKLTQIAEKEAENIELNNQLEEILYSTNIEGQSFKTNINQVKNDFQAIKTSLIKNGVEIAEGTRTAEYAGKIDEVFENGRQSQYDDFWDAYQLNGDRRNYNSSFMGEMWTDEIYNPKYDIVVTGTNNGTNLFRANLLTNTKKPFIFKSGNPSYVCAYCNNLTKIHLLEVHKDITYTGWFINCFSLADVTIIGEIGNSIDLHWSTVLTKPSITSIVNALSSTTGATLTLSKKAVNNAFETSAGAADGENSEEWINLINEHNGLWTINLS